MRSIAQKYIDDGKAESIQEGIAKIAINMLRQKANIKFIPKVTGYNIEQVTNLKKDINSYS